MKWSFKMSVTGDRSLLYFKQNHAVFLSSLLNVQNNRKKGSRHCENHKITFSRCLLRSSAMNFKVILGPLSSVEAIHFFNLRFFADCKLAGSTGLNSKSHLAHLDVLCHSSEAELWGEVLGEVSSHNPSMKNHICSGVSWGEAQL